MRTIIAGSRSVSDPATVERAVRECGWWPSVILSGKARGVDTLGERWADQYGIPVEPFPVTKEEWDRLGRAAGPIRNAEMAKHCDALVAVWDGRSSGTRDMIEAATRLGRRVHVLTVAPPAAIPAPPSADLLATVPLPPPELSALQAGAQLVAGLGYATIYPDLDFETASDAGYVWDDGKAKWYALPGATKKGLKAINAAVYAKHPSTRVLTLAYDLKEGRGRRRWHAGEPPPQELFDHVLTGKPLEAWNVGFERWIWEEVCERRMGWPAVQPHQWRCAMAKSRAHALPGKLEKAGEVLNLRVQKDDDGTRLIEKFSNPHNPTKADPRTHVPLLWTPAEAEAHFHSLNPGAMKPAAQRKLWAQVWEDHIDTLKLADYNETDIESEAEASSRTPDLDPTEFRYWQDDQDINHRGVQIDVESMHNCIAIIEQAQARYGDEMRALAGCLPSELQQLQGWLRAHGVFLDSMDEEAIEEALKKPLPPHCRRALEIRAAVGSASVKKVFAMRNNVTSTGRLHDTYVYHGARTGRPTGAGVQSTNLPKAGPNVYKCPHCGRHHGAHTMWCHWCGKVTVRGPMNIAGDEWNPEAMEDALEAISHRSLDWLEVLFGDAMQTIAGVLRGLFIAAEGMELVSSDFTAIEGVIIACLAGEQWRIDAYQNDEPMYLLSAERMYGTTVAEMKAYAKANGRHHPLRQKGKFGELGLGFGGWIGALRGLGVEGADDELKDMVLKWRGASPYIEWLWGGQKKGPADVIRQNAGLITGADRWDKSPEYFGLEGMAVSAVMNPGNEYRVMRLDGTDSGISYLMRGDALYCRVPSGGLITYHRPRLAEPTESWRGMSLSFEGWNSNAKMGPPGWIRMNTYSGKLAENVTQKTARDKQMGAIRRLQSSGYPIVMHTYDENVGEVPIGAGSIEHFEQTMCVPDVWNVGWPIKAAGGWRGRRYRKA